MTEITESETLSTLVFPTHPPEVVHQLPNMRLPSQTKVAFNSSQLQAQQSDMRTFDHGLHVVMLALHAIIKYIVPDPTTVVFDYTINFCGATTPITRQYSVVLRSPDIGRWQLIQTLKPDMSMVWTFATTPDVSYTFELVGVSDRLIILDHTGDCVEQTSNTNQRIIEI